MRYVLSEPNNGPEGNPFWEIKDTKENFEVFRIYDQLPFAESITRSYLILLNSR